MCKRLWLLIVFIFLSPFAQAARPLSTDDSGTVSKGEFEMELGLDYMNGFDKETTIGLVIKRGILNNLDLGVETGYLFINATGESNRNGFADLAVSAKFNFIKDRAYFPDSSLSFTYISDTANNDKGLGAGKPEYAINGIFSKSFDFFLIHLNAGYIFREDFKDEDNEDGLSYGFAVEYPLNEKFNIVGEISGETVLKGKFHDNSCSALFGFNYSLNEFFVLDLGIGTEISRADPVFRLTSGITIGF